MMTKNVQVILNGKEVYGHEGQKIIDLCSERGIKIPTLCFDPHLSIHGGCSVCLVEIEGARALMRACTNTIANGMVIKTDTERVTAARRLALELLLSDHVGDCRPPCNLTCPASGNVQAYINLAAQGKFRESVDTLHEHVTLPSSIGRVCPAPCQEKCRRNLADEKEPVSIREIKRFVTDWARKSGSLGDVPKIENNGKNVAVVGGGPAGLSCAYYLRLMGYDVTVFEKEKYLGGMMRYGIPDYRLPPEVLTEEAEWVTKAHGVKINTGRELGRDISLEKLRAEFGAVVLAMGCWKSSAMRVEGENLPGVIGGIDFLYTVNNHEPMKLGKRVAVVGGGNTAMDACRCAVRGAGHTEKVYIVYRRTEDEMPAEKIEIKEAREEGVEFIFLAAPKAIEGNGKVERLVCEKMALGEPDASGRRSPVPTGEIFTIEVDNVIAAIGQGVDFKNIPAELHDGRKMKVNENYETPLPGVFVCGDQQTGAKIAIEAIGNGHFCAQSIDAWFKTGVAKKPFIYDITNPNFTADDIEPEKRAAIPRQHPREEDAQTRLARPNEEYNYGLDEEQTLADAARCLECGCADVFECKLREYAIDFEVKPERLAGEHVSKAALNLETVNEYYVRNMDKCVVCGRCVRICDEVAGVHAIDFTKRGFETLLSPQFYRDMKSSECTFCGLCVQVCPVGALIERESPRKPHSETPICVKTTCPHCPLGCELILNMDAARKRILRVTTDLDAPNKGLTCLKGRYEFEDLMEGRLLAPKVEGKNSTWEEAIPKLGAALKNKKVATFIGGSITNEEIEALKNCASRSGSEFKIASPYVEGFGEFDTNKKSIHELVQEATKRVKKTEVLKKSPIGDAFDALIAKCPNVRGIAESGIVNSKTSELVEAIKRGEVDTVLFAAFNPRKAGFKPDDLKKVFSIYMTCQEKSGFELNLQLPGTPWAEKEGTFTGIFDGEKLPLRAAMLPLGDERGMSWMFAQCS